jgi:plasmid stabilization system protein ParE
MRARLTRQAQRDFDDAVAWFARERSWLADQFLAELKDVFERLLADPETGPLVEFPIPTTNRQWRRIVVKPFSYVVAYFVSGDVIVIASITHSSRDWISRLTDREF